jgi:glutathione S-transferase
MRLFTYSSSGNGYKIDLALALLGRHCERIEVAIFQGEGQTPEFLARNPSGRIPVLELDDGTCLPESNAILWYLAQGTWLCPADHVTIADLAAYAYTHLAGDVGIDLTGYPQVATWCARIEALPGYIPGPAPYTPDAIVGG